MFRNGSGMMADNRKLREQHAKSMRDDFNSNNEIGQPVSLILDEGLIVETYLRSKAWVIGGHTAVAKVEGKTGGWDVTRIRPRSGDNA